MQPLVDLLAIDVDPEQFPVTAQLQDLITHLMSGIDHGTYDVDAVLGAISCSVVSLEAQALGLKADISNRRTDLLNLYAYVCNLETRLLEAGVRLRRTDNPFSAIDD